MKDQIKKLDMSELLEVSGGRENYVRGSWAKEFNTVGLGEGKKQDGIKSLDDVETGDERGE